MIKIPVKEILLVVDDTFQTSVEGQSTSDMKGLASRGGQKVPTMGATQYAIADIHALLHPKRQMVLEWLVHITGLALVQTSPGVYATCMCQWPG